MSEDLEKRIDSVLSNLDDTRRAFLLKLLVGGFIGAPLISSIALTGDCQAAETKDFYLKANGTDIKGDSTGKTKGSGEKTGKFKGNGEVGEKFKGSSEGTPIKGKR